MGEPKSLMLQGLNDPSFFRKGGVDVDLRSRGRVVQEVGRDPVDGSWYVDLKDERGQHIRSVMTPQQAMSMCLGILNTLERYGMAVPFDWRKWTPPR